jgi:hypothetical protein
MAVEHLNFERRGNVFSRFNNAAEVRTQECAWCEKEGKWMSLTDCSECDHFREGPQGSDNPLCAWQKNPGSHWLHEHDCKRQYSAEEFPRIVLGFVWTYVQLPMSAGWKVFEISKLLDAYASIMAEKM